MRRAHRQSPIRVDVGNIVDFARQTGPLFGVSETEIVRDWAYAAVSALVAVRIQEFLNGNCNIAKVRAIRQIDKVVISSEADESSFIMYSIYLGISGGYAADYPPHRIERWLFLRICFRHRRRRCISY